MSVAKLFSAVKRSIHRTGSGNNIPPEVPSRQGGYPTTDDDDDDDDDDVNMWGSDFSDSGNDSDDPYSPRLQQPHVPPRPNRRPLPARQPAPPVPNGPDKIYDEANDPMPPRYHDRPPIPVPVTDKEAYKNPKIVSPYNAGTQPPTPGSRSSDPPPPAVPSRPKPNVPKSNPPKATTPIGRRPQPRPPSDDEADYIEPQEDSPQIPPEKPPRVTTTLTKPKTMTTSTDNKPEPPPVSRIPKKAQDLLDEQPDYEKPNMDNIPPRPGKKEPVAEETYEQPDGPGQESRYEACNNNVNTRQEETYEVPELDDKCNENYLDITGEDSIISPPLPQRPVTKPVQSSGRTQGKKFESRPPPPKPTVPEEEQEDYEIPESDPVVRNATKNYVSVLHKPTTNGISHAPPALPKQRQKIPPPPVSATTPAVTSLPPATQVEEAKAPKPEDAFEANLLQQKWYHGNITRKSAAEQLARHGLDGMYLIRKSTQGGSQPYTLQIYYSGKDYNLPVKKTDSQYSVGNNTKMFASLKEMVNVFKSSTLLLNNSTMSTKLVKSMPKQ